MMLLTLLSEIYCKSTICQPTPLKVPRCLPLCRSPIRGKSPAAAFHLICFMCFPTPLPRSRLFHVEPRNRTYSWASLKVLKGVIQPPVTHHIPLGAPRVQAVASEDQGGTRLV